MTGLVKRGLREVFYPQWALSNNYEYCKQEFCFDSCCFVSSFYSDTSTCHRESNPKTIIVPDDYPTIASAIGNATNGDTILVRSGTYEGPINNTIVIKKSISVIGESATNTIINLHPAYNSSWILTAEFFTYTDAIRITADNCALMNLKFSIEVPEDISAL